MSEPWEIPTTWEWATMREVSAIVGGGTPATSNGANFGGEIAWLTPADLSGYSGKSISRGARNLTSKGYQDSGAQLMPAGSVLFSSRAPIGYVAIAANEISTNQGFKSFVPESEIQSDYLYYYLHRAKPLAIKLASGTTFLEISGKNAAIIPIPVPPHAEQSRIAEKLDELLSDLDAAVATLERVRSKIKPYRAAVLKAAVEGNLTAAWRSQNPATESAADLLTRILVERRKRWEETQLRKFQEQGKTPPKDWKAKYKEPAAPDTAKLPELPEGWCWASLDQVALIAGGVTKGQKFSKNSEIKEVPYLRVANVQRGYLDLTEIKTIHASTTDIEALALRPGDILFNEGGDRDKLGRGWIWEGQIDECVHQNHVFRGRLISDEMQPKIVSWSGNSYGQQWFMKAGKQSVNLASISLMVLRSFPVPLSPLAEQAAIVEAVEDQLSVIDHLEADLEAKLKSAQALRQAILRDAFEGKLVPQDPNDEPAAELLKRIAAARAERAAAANAARAIQKLGGRSAPRKARRPSTAPA